MLRGEVVGEVWATRKVDALTGARLVLVREAGTQRVIVARDPMEARVGERVLVAMGSGGRLAVTGGADDRSLVCDAAVAMIVDGD